MAYSMARLMIWADICTMPTSKLLDFFTFSLFVFSVFVANIVIKVDFCFVAFCGSHSFANMSTLGIKNILQLCQCRLPINHIAKISWPHAEDDILLKEKINVRNHWTNRNKTDVDEWRRDGMNRFENFRCLSLSLYLLLCLCTYVLLYYKKLLMRYWQPNSGCCHCSARNLCACVSVCLTANKHNSQNNRERKPFSFHFGIFQFFSFRVGK